MIRKRVLTKEERRQRAIRDEKKKERERVIVSLERIANGIDRINVTMEKILEALERKKDTVERGSER